jgi:predicted DNA-binding transcriptional regulator YafY
MDRLERFYRIDRLLKERRLVSFAVFKSELGMSPASVKRDLAYMRDRFNAPIEYDREANGYRFGAARSGPRYELPGLWFNASEVLALLTTLRMLGELQPGMLEGQIEPLRERLRSILGSGDHSWQEVQKRIRIFQPGRREAKSAQGSGATHNFSTIAAAVLRRSRLWIRHYNRKRDEETEREISPQRLVHYRDNWYLDAWCHLREDLRSFAVDAIRDSVLKDKPARNISEAQLDEHLGAGYGIFAGRKVEWAKLRFTPEAARWVSAQSWHPKQRARFEDDGSYLLEVPYAEDAELLMEVLKYGADAEVLAPERLRERAAQALARASRRYS